MKKGFTSVLIIFLLLAALIILYLRNNQQKEFLKGVTGIYMLHQNKKMVYSNGIYITNDELDKTTAKKVTSIPAGEFKMVRVPYYNQDYIVAERPMGETSIDYIVFDGDGKIITDSLLRNSSEFKTDFHIGEHDSIPLTTIVNLRDDGTIILKIGEQNNNNLIKFDLITGKYKGKV